MTSDMIWAEYLELCEAATRGPWIWWTSNSWRRLVSEGKLGDLHRVLTPTISRADGHPDCSVRESDMRFIASSRTMGPKAAQIALAVEKWLEAVALGQCRVPLETTPKMMLTAIRAGKGPDE